MSDSKIVSAFLEASKALGFAFVPALTIQLEDGRTLRSLGLVRDFGSKQGMLIFSEDAELPEEDRSTLFMMGYVSSILFEPYDQYDESYFKATLNDWQFFGDTKSCPSWYTGEPW